jgi:hypothetical protein
VDKRKMLVERLMTDETTQTSEFIEDIENRIVKNGKIKDPILLRTVIMSMDLVMGQP